MSDALKLFVHHIPWSGDRFITEKFVRLSIPIGTPRLLPTAVPQLFVRLTMRRCRGLRQWFMNHWGNMRYIWSSSWNRLSRSFNDATHETAAGEEERERWVKRWVYLFVLVTEAVKYKFQSIVSRKGDGESVKPWLTVTNIYGNSRIRLSFNARGFLILFYDPQPNSYSSRSTAHNSRVS